MTDRIGFVGLGQMGLPMAARLLAAGYAVQGYDAAEAGRGAFAATGGIPCDCAADAARSVQIFITMLPNDRIVHDVLIGQGGAAGALPEGAIIIDMSSSSPLATRELGRQLGERGLRLIDAPVSGGVGKARNGALAIMTGGDAAAIDHVRPILMAMGSTLFATGPLGSGHAMKALNNYVSAAGLAAACEAVIVGAEFGLSGDIVVDVLNASTGRNNATENKLRQFILSGGFDAGFSIGLMAKDLGIAAALARGARRSSLGMIEAEALWGEAAKALGGTADHTAIYRYLETLTDQALDPSAEVAE